MVGAVAPKRTDEALSAKPVNTGAVITLSIRTPTIFTAKADVATCNPKKLRTIKQASSLFDLMMDKNCMGLADFMDFIELVGCKNSDRIRDIRGIDQAHNIRIASASSGW